MALATTLRSVSKTTARVAIWLAPKLWVASREVGRASCSALRLTWTHRQLLIAGLARGAWWLSLALLVREASSLFDLHAPLRSTALTRGFVHGLGLATIALLLGRDAHVRWTAWLLAVAHGALALLLLDLLA